MRMACMVKDAWQMLYRTEEWLPYRQFMQNMLGNIATLAMKAQLCVQFFHTFPLVQHFIQSECTGGWSLLQVNTRIRDYVYFMQVASFIMQNWWISAIWRCAPCRMNMGMDEFHSYREEGFFTIRCWDRFWVVSGLTWPQNRYRHAQKWLLVGSHEGAKLQRTLWLSGHVPVCIPLCFPTEEPNGSQAESSEHYCEACHHNDLRPAQQAADLGQFMWNIEAHLLLYGHYHGDLDSLSSGITGDSSVNCQQ